ncbi:hypothetical protein FHX73_16538 [Kitasatospora viridis]|uniref:Uncharacterized protein n=1 Tax=Kitasatospora viridis TaxID=281105 RepID=A0A561SEW8_9ACTN|nr:hypothetical protein FHX73_16538 [Kitasatospora viridis]
MPGVEHAGGAGRTLCGTRGRYLRLFLHHFQPQALASCRKCRALAEGAPSRPCGQERLHDPLLQEAEDGPLRTDLLAALRRGARIAIWITGPAKDLTRFHSRIDRMTEEAGPAAGALAAATTSVTLARVEDTDRQYLVVLPPDGREAGPPRSTASPLPHRARGGGRLSCGLGHRCPAGLVGGAGW